MTTMFAPLHFSHFAPLVTKFSCSPTPRLLLAGIGKSLESKQGSQNRQCAGQNKIDLSVREKYMQPT